MGTRTIFIVAGEPSGDRLGAELMRALRRRSADEIRFEGVGGPQMEAEGLSSLFPISDIAVLGVFEILPRLRLLLRRINETARACIASGADALVTIDAPGFSLRVSPKVKAARPEIRTIHYVAPSVWAWRPNRAKLMARHTDHVLALLPFEPPYMTEVGMGCDFVGHPIAELEPPPAAEIEQFRDGFASRPILLVLLGSRRSEVARLGPIFGETVAQLAQAVPGLQVVIPAAGAVIEDVEAMVATWPVPVHLLDPRGMAPAASEARKFLAFAGADVALAASGTVVMELAAMGCPMVAGYKLNALTAFVVRRLLRVKSGNLVNLLTDSDVVPEFYQEDCTPDALAGALLPLFMRGAERAAQLAAEAEAMRAIGRGGEPPSDRAASAVLRVIGAPEAGTP
ncbi:lipid-A-disaccharide synthase [Paroceanicella profunda]|uniref:Lipid-A-disaccharide synthase n=1 Tax=Paroceanicella profunda TaxID=2579971 RepID=A0A5B8FHY7_9RHOB|nr:lipid-A-disaccharide synthase [Paroceanicella profunda]QDL92747.1 lipid-A-disaccharide synthase [Paroceanicella profunda]